MSQLTMGPPTGLDSSWMERGSCRRVDPDIFYVPDGTRGQARQDCIAAAKRVCLRCPVLAKCREFALATREPHGVWGGLSEEERSGFRGGVPVNFLDGRDSTVVDALIDGLQVPTATLVDRAHAAVRLWQQGGFTKAELGRRFGVKDRTVGHWLRRVQDGLPPISMQHIRNLQISGRLPVQAGESDE